jgi:tetratricopeptide (TPR) repeat protein
MAQEQAKLNLLARVYPIPKPVPLDADSQQELSFQIALGLGSGGSLAHHLRGLQPSLAPNHPGQLLLRGLAEMRLSPVDPFLFGTQQGSAYAHFFAGRYDEALTWAKMALREQPHSHAALRIAAASSALAGRGSEAIDSAPTRD